MAEYLTAVNDEWVPDLTAEEVTRASRSTRPVVEEMESQALLLDTHGGLHRSTAVCSVEAVDGDPVVTDGPHVETAVALGWPQEVHRFPPRRGHDGRPVGSGEG